MAFLSTKEGEPRLDAALALSLAGLMGLGVLFIYSATRAYTRDLPVYREQYFMQILWYAAGCAAATALCLLDYRRLARYSFVLYWAIIIALVLVLVPGIGQKILGARRWFNLGVFKLQPSEFAKIAFILAQAHFLSRPINELSIPRNFFKALLLTALPFLLIMREPDLGSALVLLPTSLLMMVVAGVPRRFLQRLLLGVGVLVALFLVDVLFAPPNWQIKLEDYQRRRLWVYFGRDYASDKKSEADKQKARFLQYSDSYSVRQALISVGSGGFWGKGWCKGTQNALGFLPRAVAHNYFIFSVIAEEKGFLGSVLVLTLYAGVLFTGIRIAGQTRDRLGKLLAVGVVTLLFSHVFINIGMNIRIMPVTGVPLPLLSYGGSSVLCSLIAAGILHNVYLYQRS